jgi:hypothetical protein
LLPHAALLAAMHASLPSHRQHLAEKNVALLNLGADFVSRGM